MSIEETELDPSISGIQTGRMCGGYIIRGIDRVTGLSWETPYYTRKVE